MSILQELLELRQRSLLEDEQTPPQPSGDEQDKTPAEAENDKPASDDDEHKSMKDHLQDMFKEADSNGSLQPYVKNETLQAKEANVGEQIHQNFPGVPAKNVVTKEGDLVVRDAENPNSIKVMPKHEFEAEYELEKTDSKPDAEGYIPYRSKGQILAFQYNEHEPLRLQDEHGHTIHVKFGDYLGYEVSDATVLIQLDKTHFEKTYRLES